jgi:hypothetical protein
LAERPDLASPEPLPERDQRQRLYDAAARAILAAGGPLLLVADDLQWCAADVGRKRSRRGRRRVATEAIAGYVDVVDGRKVAGIARIQRAWDDTGGTDAAPACGPASSASSWKRARWPATTKPG